MKQRNKKVIYYSDSKNDDFAATKVKEKILPDSYQYIHSFWAYRFLSFLLRTFVAIPVLFVFTKVKLHTRFKNKKVLKSVKKTGYFIYSNHTNTCDPMHHALVNPLKHTVFTASHATFSIKGIKWLVELLGAFPVPKNKIQYDKYLECMKYHIQKKHKIIIYPEAHIWNYFTGIRPFGGGSFRYPVLFDTPIIVTTTIYKKRRFRNKLKAEIYLDGPFYPNKNLDYEKAVDELKDVAYQTMLERASNKENFSYFEYVRKE